MRDVLISLVCLYFGITNIRQLAKLPLAEWQFVQYALALVTLVLLVLGVLMGWRAIRAMGVAQSRAKEEAARLRGEADAEEDEPEED